MSKYLKLLAVAVILSGCEAIPVEEEGPSLVERMNSAAMSVTYVTANSPDWCTAGSSCQYMGEIHCNTGRENPTKVCRKKIGKKVIRSGGDTYVEQAGGLIQGASNLYDKNGYYRTYGKVYKCSNQFGDLYTESLKSHPSPAKTHNEILSKDYFEKCRSTNKKCVSTLSETCGTIRDKPFKLCAKVIRDAAILKGFETAVIDRELFNKFSAYRVFFNGYNCK